MAVKDIVKYTFRNQFEVSVVQFEKACVVNAPEQIDTYTIYWIKEGGGIYHIDFNQYTFQNNVIFFLTPGQVFSVDSEKIKEAYKLSFKRDFYCIETHDKDIACNGILFNNVYETPFVNPDKRDTLKLEAILSGLIEEFRQSDTAQYDMLQSLLKQFIIHAVRIKKQKDTLINNEESKLFKDFSLLVEHNYRTMHSVTDYAGRLGVSPKSLTKHLQKIGQPSPSSIIKERLILEAKRQLLYSGSTVKQIAFDLGFNDPAYFTRFFTKMVSKSPLQFKNNFK